VKVIFFIGLVLNLGCGYFILLAFNHVFSVGIEDTTEALEVIPEFITLIFLGDALRRIRIISKNTFEIDSWQVTVHMIAFLLVAITGILLCIVSYHNPNQTYKPPSNMYHVLDTLILTVFLA
jgi:uncharacterized protein with PQ loop repeat